ncbi:MAG: hypothetical protein Q4F95_01740 [Oscillospiraceae bacterium]|nr:hypothetical protein [Oscillospiraceae bacterium]
MTLEQYRIKHSQIIECFQWIEFNLKRIYAKLSGKSLLKTISVLDKENLGSLIVLVKQTELQNNTCYLSDEDYELLDQIREMRNYWCHQCYLDVLFRKDEKKNLVVRNQDFANKLTLELYKVEELHYKFQDVYFNIRK